MKSLTIALGALAAWTATALDVSAAWNNVYQPTLTCFFRKHHQQTANYCCPPAVAYSSPVVAASPCPTPCQPQCTTTYVKRSFYQPVTTYVTQSYYEAVTTQQTSYYYEPVTSYRYSCYYDPCTCSYQQVATPQTCYQLRSQCCPVQTWVKRCCQVPVTTMQESFYLEPRTTCCTTTVGAPIPYPNGGPTVISGGAPAAGNPPSVIANPPPQQTAPPPQMPQIKDSFAPSGPNVGNTSLQQQSQWQAPATMTPSASGGKAQPNPQVKLDRIVFGPESYVEGQIVRTDNAPRPNVNVLFVSADNGQREMATANNSGRFQISLASGNWLVYVQARDGTAQFHSKLSVQEHQTARLTVVN